MSETETETETEVVVGDFFTAETYSPYGVIKAVNAVLKALEIEKVLPGPMGYTYCKKGYIATVPGSNAKLVTRAAAIEWTEKYLGKLAAKQTMQAEIVEEVTEAPEADLHEVL